VYDDTADDRRCDDWVAGAMRRLEPISVGAQMNDENMAGTPASYLSEAASGRLEQLRRKYDPGSLFV
jgi:hypothetical protein